MKANKDLYGLVLAGGKSSRMGFDKGLIEYRAVPHREYLFSLLTHFCAEAFLGVRATQQEEVAGFPLILDNEGYNGPFRSILAAHDAYPDKAWLVVACDLPYLTEKTIQKLVEKRDSSKMATTYYNESSGFLEPLITIWEPAGLEKAKAYGAEGGKCPRKFLMNEEIRQVRADNDEELKNANYPEDYEQAKKVLR